MLSGVASFSGNKASDSREYDKIVEYKGDLV
jgi:hypothetical protein